LSFDADLRTAAGARVFLRDVTWAVDPASVGTISALPIVRNCSRPAAARPP